MEFKSENHRKIKLHSYAAAAFPENHLTIRIPDYRAFKVVTRFVLLTSAIVLLPYLGSIVGDSPNSLIVGQSDSLLDHITLLPKFVKDLTNERLFNPGQKVLILVDAGADNYWKNKNIVLNSPLIWGDSEIAVISESDFERRNSIPDYNFDFVFTSGFQDPKFIERVLKIGGIVAVRLSDDPSKAFHNPSNYKIVYIRRFECTIAAMKKTGPYDTFSDSPAKRRLLAFGSEAKKAALDGLEDVLLEPPTKWNNLIKRTKYLPDLMGDSLYDYPRRVFIDVRLPGRNGGSTEWFKRNYPTRNRDFTMYKIEMVNNEVSKRKAVPEVGISDWLRKNVKEEEYVVMKAEAEVVEEMMSKKAIRLVDELFLECKHQWQGGKGQKSRRAYWECLALYGRLRDEGVAVHQWWG